MIEGMAQGSLGANWGDGHATDAGLMTMVSPNADPNAFYKQLLSAPYAGNAIISAHVYPYAPFPRSLLCPYEDQSLANSTRAWGVAPEG